MFTQCPCVMVCVWKNVQKRVALVLAGTQCYGWCGVKTFCFLFQNVLSQITKTLHLLTCREGHLILTHIPFQDVPTVQTELDFTSSLPGTQDLYHLQHLSHLLIMLDISEMMYQCQDLGIIKSNPELSPGSGWQDVVHHRMPAFHEPRGQVSLKWGGGKESADVPAISPVSFDLHAAAYYEISLPF